MVTYLNTAAERKWICFGLLLFFLVGGIAGCAPRRLIVHETVAIMADGAKAFETHSDLDMLAQALPAHIKLLEGLLASDPGHSPTLVLLAKLYAFYSFAVVEDRLEALRQVPPDPGRFDREKELGQKLTNHYRKGAQYALRALAADFPDFQKRLMRASLRDELLQRMTRKQVPAFFWYGFNQAGFINQNRDSVRALAQLGAMRDIMKRVWQLHPEHFHRGALLLLMAIDGGAPAMMGGRPDAVARWYRLCSPQDAPSHLLADLFYARYGLVHQQQSAGRRLLEKIVHSESGPLERRLLDAIARKRARRLLAGRQQDAGGGTGEK